MRKEPNGVGSRAPRSAIHLAQAEGRQALPSERREVTLPTTFGIRLKCRRSAGLTCEEGLTNLLAHLEMRRPDRRSEPGDEI
jgi:hypothetical protein